jgi:hypothetical protein
MSVSFECCVISGSLYDEVFTRPEEYYRVCFVFECDCEASIMRRVWPIVGCCVMGQNKMSVNDELHVAADIILEEEHPVCNLLAVGWATGRVCKQRQIQNFHPRREWQRVCASLPAYGPVTNLNQLSNT